MQIQNNNQANNVYPVNTAGNSHEGGRHSSTNCMGGKRCVVLAASAVCAGTVVGYCVAAELVKHLSSREVVIDESYAPYVGLGICGAFIASGGVTFAAVFAAGAVCNKGLTALIRARGEPEAPPAEPDANSVMVREQQDMPPAYSKTDPLETV